MHPIAALQSEWSLWTRDVETEVLAACRRLGMGVVPFSPLGRGFLTGTLNDPDGFEAGDMRRTNPRFQGENFTQNLRPRRRGAPARTEKGGTAGQVALAWVMHQGDDVVPIPGTKRRTYLEENVGACRDRAHRRRPGPARRPERPSGAAAGARYN